jgi:probable HAF family extracellular repeat protein
MSSDRAYRWAGTGPPQDLGLLAGNTRAYARGISGDGGTLVGACESSQFTQAIGQAFRWTASGGMQGLGYTSTEHTFSLANAISRDGSTIVGYSADPLGSGEHRAFRWTQATGMQALPGLVVTTSNDDEANAVSANGAVIVGSATAAPLSYSHAARWMASGIQDLGTLSPAVSSTAYATSDDGNVVGGVSGSTAFVWTPSTGMLSLSDYLLANGIVPPAGYRLEYVYAISGDGLTFAGQATNLSTNLVEGFVATVPEPCVAIVLILSPLAYGRRRG